MLMTSNKISVSALVEICYAHGLRDVVFSPGSRNAPLIIAFNEDGRFECSCVHDERVAAFFAMGISLKTGLPTIIACTSGSAALNYAPAVAEAYYQQIPLLILTADRPVEWVDQGNGQTIRQRDIYGRHVKKSFELLQEADHEDELWHNDRVVNEAIITSLAHNHGPVHINIPLREPLYETVQSHPHQPKVIRKSRSTSDLNEHSWRAIQDTWNTISQKMIIVGQQLPDSRMTSALTALAVDRSVIVLSETTSNVDISGHIACIDRTIDSIEDDMDTLRPELLLTIGGEIVSKKIKALIRKHRPAQHWHVDASGRVLDTYQSLTQVIQMPPVVFLEKLVERITPQWEGNYANSWMTISKIRAQRHLDYFNNCKWSDFKAFGTILAEVPSQSILHLANSTPIRYHQLFDARFDLDCYCNRGTSGIDGSISTAAGMASQTDKVVTIITGDTSFFYDSNALWIKDLPTNLRIIILNNSGGNIFRIIPGPASTNQLEDYFEGHHNHDASCLASAFGLQYWNAENLNDLQIVLQQFYNQNNNLPSILEIFTPRKENDGVLKEYFEYLNK